MRQHTSIITTLTKGVGPKKQQKAQHHRGTSSSTLCQLNDCNRHIFFNNTGRQTCEGSILPHDQSLCGKNSRLLILCRELLLDLKNYYYNFLLHITLVIICKNWVMTDEVLVWWYVWSKVQIVCIWFSWWHWIPKLPSSLASFKSRHFTFLVPAYPAYPGKY